MLVKFREHPIKFSSLSLFILNVLTTVEALNHNDDDDVRRFFISCVCVIFKNALLLLQHNKNELSKFYCLAIETNRKKKLNFPLRQAPHDFTSIRLFDK